MAMIRASVGLLGRGGAGQQPLEVAGVDEQPGQGPLG